MFVKLTFFNKQFVESKIRLTPNFNQLRYCRVFRPKALSAARRAENYFFSPGTAKCSTETSRSRSFRHRHDHPARLIHGSAVPHLRQPHVPLLVHPHPLHRPLQPRRVLLFNVGSAVVVGSVADERRGEVGR